MSRSRIVAVVAALVAVGAVVAIVVVATGGGDDDGASPADEIAAEQPASDGEDANGDADAEDGDSDAGPEAEEVPDVELEHIDPPQPIENADNSIIEFGSEASDEQAERIATVLAGYLASRAEGRNGAACSLIADQVKEQLSMLASAEEDADPDEACPAALEYMTSQTPRRHLRQLARVRLGTVRIEDDRAFVVFKNDVTNRWSAIPMYRESGEWRVGLLNATQMR